MSAAFDFSGKVALVTGVGRAGQIGNAVALALGRAGAEIIACDLNAVGVAERVREFASLGVDARPCAGDLTQPDVAALAVELALRHFGRLDVVVNVAGGLTTYGPIGALTVQDMDREVAINLKTTMLVSQAAIPALIRTRGCIVNFASIAYFAPQSPMAWARRSAGKAAMTRARDAGTSIAAPRACTTLAATRSSTVGATPQSTDASVKSSTPDTNDRRRPTRSVSRPKTMRNAAKTML